MCMGCNVHIIHTSGGEGTFVIKSSVPPFLRADLLTGVLIISHPEKKSSTRTATNSQHKRRGAPER